MVRIYKNFLSNHDFFLKIFLQACGKYSEPEPQFVISALAPGGNLISAQVLQHCLLKCLKKIRVDLETTTQP
jgi:hypothetical protein